MPITLEVTLEEAQIINDALLTVETIQQEVITQEGGVTADIAEEKERVHTRLRQKLFE
tara:strand:+ start:314 stop:487 length:174 start_codon:yes stop_codon:yes gene_type:complete